MGIWISVLIALFVIGSVTMLKPSGMAQRLDKLRMQARQLGLNPKLLANPDWLPAPAQLPNAEPTSRVGSKGMIARYGVIIDDVQLPQTRYRVIDGCWYPIDSGTNAKAVQHALTQQPLDLPKVIAEHVKGLQSKANSVMVYWDDAAYARPASNPNYHSSAIDADFVQLKAQLLAWAARIDHANTDPTTTSSQTMK